MRLVTFNVKHGASIDDGYKRGNPELLAEECASLGADILAVEEVDNMTRRTGKVDVVHMIGRVAGMQGYFAPTMLHFDRGQYGNALFVRGKLEWLKVLNLQPTGFRHGFKKEPRNAIIATTRIRGRSVSVAATHLATQRKISELQLPQVIHALHCRPGPRVLMGDLNLPYEAVEGPLIDNGNGLAPVDGVLTFPPVNSRTQIDHIAVRGLVVTEVEARVMKVSDHRALIVDVEWPDTVQ